MEYLQLLIAMLAVVLFCWGLTQPFRIAWGMFREGRDESRRRYRDEKGPDDVVPLPILDTREMPSYHSRIGRDRFGRMIFSSPYADGRMGYFYLDKEASEAHRRKVKSRQDVPDRPVQDSEPGLALGWKGFDANSSAWDVLGVARDASIKEVKAAYRRLITKFHPDLYQNLSAAEIADLENDTKRIHAAYAELAKS